MIHIKQTLITLLIAAIALTGLAACEDTVTTTPTPSDPPVIELPVLSIADQKEAEGLQWEAEGVPREEEQQKEATEPPVVELSGVIGDRTTFSPSGPGSATQTSNTNPSLFQVSDDGAVSTIVLPLENTDDQVPPRLAGPFAVTGNGSSAMDGIDYWVTVDVATNATAMFSGFGYGYGDAIYTMGSDAVIVLVSDYEGTLTFNIYKGDGSEPIQFSSDQDRSSITIQVAPAAAVAEVEEAEITFPVAANIIEDDCTSGNCWDYEALAPNFYGCEASTDAAFLAANCTLENITVLVNKSCGKIANSARPKSYQYYFVWNPSDTPLILDVKDGNGNWVGIHTDYAIDAMSGAGLNFQHNLYNGYTYDIRGKLSLEDGTVVTEFPIYTQTKNC